MHDVESAGDVDERVVEVALGLFDEGLDLPLGDARGEEERARGEQEQVPVHPRELADGEEGRT